VSKPVVLSTKKLYTYSTYVTKNGSSFSAKGTSGSGAVTVSSTGYVKLTASSSTPGWAAVGWEFTLPSATVYKSLSFQVYSKGTLWAADPPNEFGVQNFTWCPYSSDWSDACFERWASLGNSTGTLTWKSTAASLTADRAGRTVRGMAEISVGTYDVYQARFAVTYGILK
jgi:hypothetical protein